MPSPLGPDEHGVGEAAEAAYRAILNMVLTQEVASGDRLRETALAELLGVSRTPVRQALNRLAAEGLVTLSPNKGAQVASWTEGDALAVLSLRALVEPFAVKLAVPVLDDASLATLEELDEQMRALGSDAGQAAEMGRLNVEFHGVFIAATQNSPLTASIMALARPALVTRTFSRYSPEAMRRSMNHHSELIVAARARDADWAESVMRSHILAARHAYL